MDIKMSAADYNLILENAVLPPALEMSLRAGIVEGLFLRFPLTVEACVELASSVIMAVPVCRDRITRRVLEGLVGKLYDQLGRAGIYLDDAHEAMDRSQSAYNQAPQDELGGFSPHQVHTLFTNDWSCDTPGLQLRDDAPPDLLAGSKVLYNARCMLNALSDGGTRATPAGNLNRAFVSEMLAAMRWRDDFLEELYDFNKVVNEQDAGPLHQLRIVLEVAKMITIRKSRFVLTEVGRKMMTDTQAGSLFALLVLTTFRKFNLGYQDGLIELQSFQDAIAFPLAVLSREPDGWLDYATLAPRLLLPAIANIVPSDDHFDGREILIRLRLIRQLEPLGLIECRRRRHRLSLYMDKIVKVRRTSLFDRVLVFDLSNYP